MSNPVVLILMFLAVAAAFFALGVAWGRSRRPQPLPSAVPGEVDGTNAVPLPDFAAAVPAGTATAIDAALERRHKIEAIRIFRGATGLGLADSKRVIDHWEASREAHRAVEPSGYDLEH